MLTEIVQFPVSFTRQAQLWLGRLTLEGFGNAGFRMTTLGLGALGLWLWGRAGRSRGWRRVGLSALGWTCCAAWLPLLGALLLLMPPLQLALSIPWVLILIFFLRQGRRFDTAPEAGPEPAWPGCPLHFKLVRLDRASLGLVGLVTLALFLARHTFVQYPPDAYYHLSVARDIAEHGRVPLWDTWSFAPGGRPHLYPPLFHICIALAAIPSGGNVIAGFQMLQALCVPLTLLTAWYAARWLFGPERGFLALLITGTQLPLVVFDFMGTPSAYANCLTLLILVAFLSKRLVLTTLLAAASLNLHMGVAPFLLLGLLLFALVNRGYLRFCAAVLAGAVLLSVPWYAHVWANRDWFGNASDLGGFGDVAPWMLFLYKLSWLQVINVLMVLLFCRAWGMTRWRESRNQLLAAVLFAFLPMLFSYGGRYFIHTFPLWAALIAIVFAVPLGAAPAWGRIFRSFGLAACFPSVLLLGYDPNIPARGPAVGVSGWLFVPAAAGGGFQLLEKMLIEAGQLGIAETRDAGAYIRELTPPDTVLDVQGGRNTAVMLGFFAERAIAQGAWPEVSPPPGTPRPEAPTVLHAAWTTEVPKTPDGLTWWEHGGFFYAWETRPPVP